MNIRWLTADITQLPLDAIVTAANSRLAGSGGVDGAVHRAAGPELFAACQKIGGCPSGEARITPGFRLKARWVIHAVGPVWRGGGEGEPGLLKGAYTSSLELAMTHHCRSVAFPAISCGVYGYPIAEAIHIAIAAVRGWTGSLPEKVVFVGFDNHVVTVLERLLGPASTLEHLHGSG